jgi:hypothetical protein
MKICNVCFIEKPINEFHKDKNGKFGVGGKCKLCKKEHSIIDYKNNKSYYKFKSKEWNLKNPNMSKIYNKRYNSLNKEKIRNYDNVRYKTNPCFRLQKIQKVNILSNLKRVNKGSKFNYFKSELILGCTFEEFKLYLENKFEPWMNWENQGKYNGELNHGWDLDHIIPISSAKTEEEVLRLNNYLNYQPLCSKINRDIKKDKINFYPK